VFLKIEFSPLSPTQRPVADTEPVPISTWLSEIHASNPESEREEGTLLFTS
jgi:hypothetical protein